MMDLNIKIIYEDGSDKPEVERTFIVDTFLTSGMNVFSKKEIIKALIEHKLESIAQWIALNAKIK